MIRTAEPDLKAALHCDMETLANRTAKATPRLTL